MCSNLIVPKPSWRSPLWSIIFTTRVSPSNFFKKSKSSHYPVSAAVVPSKLCTATRSCRNYAEEVRRGRLHKPPELHLQIPKKILRNSHFPMSAAVVLSKLCAATRSCRNQVDEVLRDRLHYHPSFTTYLLQKVEKLTFSCIRCHSTEQTMYSNPIVSKSACWRSLPSLWNRDTIRASPPNSFKKLGNWHFPAFDAVVLSKLCTANRSCRNHVDKVRHGRLHTLPGLHLLIPSKKVEKLTFSCVRCRSTEQIMHSKPLVSKPCWRSPPWSIT